MGRFKSSGPLGYDPDKTDVLRGHDTGAGFQSLETENLAHSLGHSPGPIGTESFPRSANPNTPSRVQLQAETSGKPERPQWRLETDFNSVIIIRFSDLRPNETYSTHPHLLVTQLDELLAGPMSKKAVLNLAKNVSEMMTGRPQSSGGNETKHELKLLLENAFRQQLLVIIKEVHGGGSDRAGAEGSGDANESTNDHDVDKKNKAPSRQYPKNQTQTTWIEIELVDNRGKPVPNEQYRLELPDGAIQEGYLDAQGLARVDGIDPGNCKISFPDIDAREWRRAGN